MTKQHLRTSCIAYRKTLDDKQVHELSNRIMQHACSLLDSLRPTSVHVYVSMRTEPDTMKLILWLQQNNIDVYVPAVHGDSLVCLKANKAVLTQAKQQPFFEHAATTCQHTHAIDIAIVPTLGFDKQLHRLGYGKGYYDRFLAEHAVTTKIGLCYEANRLETLPVEAHDIQLDYMVTEAGISTR